MSIDGAFGSAGSIWTGVPSLRRSFQGAITGTVHVGGTTVGLNPDPAGPVLVVEGLKPGASDQLTRVLTVRFAADGHSAEVGRRDGASSFEVSNSSWASALASCPAPGGGTAVLVGDRESPFTLAVTRYTIREIVYGASAVGVSAALQLPTVAIAASNDPYTVRLVRDGTDYLVVSASHGTVLIARAPRSGAADATAEIRLSGAGSALPGLYRLDVASARLDGAFLSIALTAYLQHPGVGPVSVGALLRVAPNGSRDPAFGDQGLWVSPLTNVFRQFVCAGEFSGGLVGVQGRQLVAFGIEPGGSGGSNLNDPFAVSGVLQQDLGDALSSPQSADDATHTYLFARRQDGALLGCRFDRQGVVDGAFGGAGVAVIDAAGEAATPAALAVNGGRLLVAGTRQVQGWDCDRIPMLAALDAASGRPAAAFGAGGFALHSSVGYLAAVSPDGSGWVTERRADYTLWPGHRLVGPPTVLRRLGVTGRYERPVTISPPGVQNATIASLLALEDGSTLIGGDGTPGWVAKLLPDGTLDAAFGTGGVAVPRAGVAGTVGVLGVRADGRIAIDYTPQLISAADPYAVGLLNANGSLDSAYAATSGNGFRGLSGLVVLPTLEMPDPVSSTATPFLDADGSIVVAVASRHQYDNDPHVRFGLRRIQPDGEYDTAFGLGVPSIAAPAAGRLLTLFQPVAGADAYSSVEAVGIAWMGGKLYVVACGVSGKILRSAHTSPAYSVLLVSRWQGDGSRDNTFDVNGVQEVGFSPHRLDFTPRGVLGRSPSELVVWGEAGRAETVQSVGANGTVTTSTVVRRPEPALFRVADPGGVDTAFGQGGAERLAVQEFQAAMIAARLMRPRFLRGSDRVRFVCTDSTAQPEEPRDPTTTFGGVGQFVLGPPGLLRGPLPTDFVRGPRG